MLLLFQRKGRSESVRTVVRRQLRAGVSEAGTRGGHLPRGATHPFNTATTRLAPGQCEDNYL